MKCPSCGAEITPNSKFCESCGSQISYDMEREQEQLNKQGCPQCGSSNVVFNREKQGEITGKNGTAVVRRTVGVCKDCGYTWYTAGPAPEKKKMPTWVWVLGWLFIFPLPLTFLMLRKKDISPALKYGIIALGWIAYLIMGLGGGVKGKKTEEPVAIVQETKKEEQPVAIVEETKKEEQPVAEEPHTELKKTPEDSFFEQVKHDAEWQMMPRDRCENVSLKDRTLKLEIYLTRTDKLLERYTGISNAILAIKSGYDWWIHWLLILVA